MLRAAHLLWDDEPKIFADTLALELSGCADEAVLRARLDRIAAEAAHSSSPALARTFLRTATAQIVVRSRYVEGELEQAVRHGVSQYVILGAGLDSFAYRRPDLAKVLRVFEVDHPATQARKRTRLEEIGVAVPANVTFVPVDFERQSLINGLRMSGYRTDVPAVFSWLGVTMYLTPDVIFSTLRTVAALALGTQIIFQYSAPKESVDEEAQKILAVRAAFTAARGEPIQTSFEPTELAVQVRGLGFAEVFDFSPKQATQCYFAHRTDGLRPFATEHFMSARVGPRSN
jgi:methyltransferase (TIGR00027 family)